MQRLIRHYLALALAMLLMLGFGAVRTTQVAQAAPADGVRFEILPEIFVNPATDTVFNNPKDTIGVSRSMTVYGGPQSDALKKVWQNVAFNVYDESGNLVDTTKGVVGDRNRWSGAKYLGPYPQGKAYTVKVDASTLPTGYHSWFTEQTSGYPGGDTDVMAVSKDASSATRSQENVSPIAETRFNMDIVNLAFVKNAEVAKDLFTMDGDDVTGLNPKYREGTDYFLKTVSRDGEVVVPASAETEKLFSEGYRPGSFYFMYKDEKYPLRSISAGKGYSYLRRWEGNDGVNTFEKFKSSSVFSVVLDQAIPVVNFYKGAPQEGAKPEQLASVQVYFQHSLSQNCLSDGTTCLPKELPAAPAKEGMVFKGWNTQADGSGTAFSDATVVTDNVNVYPIYAPNTDPVLEVRDATITAGEQLDLRSLITKAADEEDGADLADKVTIEAGAFDADKVGTYQVTYTLTDANGASVSKVATVTVNKKAAPVPPTDKPKDPQKPQPKTKPAITVKKKQLAATGFPGSTLVGSAFLLSAAGVFLARRSKVSD